MLVLGTDPLSIVFKVTIDTRSLTATTIHIERRLRGYCCLNVRKYGFITFVGYDLRRSGPNTYFLNGTFTFRGISRAVKFELIHQGSVADFGNDVMLPKLTVNGVINRSDFVMIDNFTDPGLSDKIYLNANIQFEPWDERDLSVFDSLESKGE
jgi:polyisoprenoid-binding protein YceI